MRVGVFAKTFAADEPLTALSAAADAGFAVAHYNLSCSGIGSLPATVSTEHAAAVAAASAATGVALCGVSATFNMIHPDITVRRRGLVALDAIAGAARTMGTDLVTLCTGTRDPDDMWRHHPANCDPSAWNDLCESLDDALRVAARHDVRLGIEPERANVVATADLARRLVDDLADDRLCIVLDPANLIDPAEPGRQHDLISSAIELLADRIAVAHVKDRRVDGTVVPPGDGIVDHAHMVAELRRARFDGPLVAHGFGAEHARAASGHLRRLVG